MDFNQILLWVSLGLLALVVLFALWGFLGGLKRELKCIAVFIVLLVLFWLVFGDKATLMNLKIGQDVAEILNIHDDSITTVWDAVLAFARIKIPNGETLLVDGMETYELFSSLAATIFRAIGLMVGTLVVLIVCPIIRLITHIIWLIVRGVRRSKAKKSEASVEQLVTESETEPSTETVTTAEPGKEQPVQAATDAKTSTVTKVEQSNEQNNQPAPEETAETKPADQVVIASNKTSADDAVITKDENEIPTNPSSKRRWWGALAGALKGIFVIILVFAPVSGLCTILNTATPETQALVSDLVNGDTKEKTANSSNDDAVSMAFDFADAYQDSAIGKFVESSGYFFGKSFSQSIFDNLLRVETKNQNFSLNDELINIVEAVNELHGKSKVGSWTSEEIKNALEQLKDSKLLVEAMPIAIEYVYGMDNVKKLINEAGQGTKFLELRYNDWKKDFPILLDVVKEAYDLNIFPLDKFNYLTMDSQQLKEVVNELCKTDVISKIMPIATRVALNIDAVKKYVGTSFYSVDFDSIDWKADLMTLTDIYEEFLKFEFKTLDDITKTKWNELAESIVDNEKKFSSAQKIVEKIAELDVYRTVGSVAIQNAVEKVFTDHATEFKGILELTGLTVDEWKEDLLAILDVVKAASEIKALDAAGKNPFNYKDLDLTSPNAIKNYKLIVDKVLSLNILGDDELKNKLVLASIRQYGWIDGEKDIDLSVVNWENEKQVLINLLDTYSDVIELEEFDIYHLENLKFDELLNSEEFLNYVVDALEIAVESKLFLQVLPGLINKYVIPKIESLKDLDDDTLVKDILDSVSSEELVEEIIKLVDVVKAALDLGVFNVNKDGINAIDFTKTDDLKTIVSGILGSKLIKNNEGRVIRVILKATGILDIEKGSDVYNEITSINYENEKVILLNFIDKIAPVLQDEEFKLLDDEGKINLDLKFWAENENAQTLLDGLEVLFGSYEENTNGSNLITALLPEIYDKFIEEKNLIPNDFIEIVNELDVTNATGKVLAHDISCLVYVLQQLVSVNAQSYLDNGSVEINEQLATTINNIIDALHDIELIRGHEKETLAWGVNYVAKTLKVEIDAVNTDFENVDWQGQKEVYKEIVTDIVNLLVENKVTNVNQLKDVVKEIIDGKSKYVTDENATEFLHILDKIADVQVIDAVLPLAIKVVVKTLDEKGLTLDYLNEFTGEELAEDFHTLVEMAHIAVDEGEFVKYYQNGFNENLALPKEEVVHKIISKALELHILADADGRLLSALYDKYVASIKIGDDPMFLTSADFNFGSIDWTTEEAVLHAIVTAFYDLSEVADFNTFAKLKEMLNNKSFTYRNFFSDEVGYILVDLLRSLENSQLVENIVVQTIDYAIDKLTETGKLPFSLEGLKGLKAENVMKAIPTLADVCDIAIEVGALEYVRTNDIAVINLDLIADLVEKLTDSDAINESVNGLIFDALKYAAGELNKSFESNIEIVKSDVDAISIRDEGKVIANAIRSLKGVFEANQIVSLNNLLDFIKEKKYKTEAFFDANLGTVVNHLADSKYLQLFLPGLFDAAIDKVKGVDLAGLKGNFTKEELGSDVKQLSNALEQIRDAGFISVVLGTKKVNELPISVEKYAEIVEIVKDTNVLNKKYSVIASALVNELLELVKSKEVVTPDMFGGIQFSDEAPSIMEALLKSKDAFTNANLVTIQDVVDMTKESKFYENEKYVNEAAVYPLIDAIEALTNLQTLEAAMNTVAKVICELANNKNMNFDYLFRGLTNAQLLADTKLAVDYARDIVDLGGLEYLTTKDIAEFDVTIVANMVEGLYDFNIMKLHAPEVMQKLVDLVNKKVPDLRIRTTIESFEAIDYEKEFATLAEVVALGSDFMDAEVCHSLNDVLDIVKLKLYTQKGFFNETAFDVMVRMANKATELQSLEVIMPDLIFYGVKQANARRIDIAFIVDDAYTPALQVEDLRTLISMVDAAYDFGFIDYVFDREIENVDFAILNNVLDQAMNLHILDLFLANFLALGYNKAFKEAKMDIVVSKYEFADVVLADEIQVLKDIVLEMNAFMDVKGYTSLSQLTNAIANKDYKYEAFYDVETGEVLANVVSRVVDLESVVVVLPYLLDFAVDKITKVDLTFLKGAFTKEELRNDIKGLANAIVPAIKAELVGLVFGKKVEELNLHFTEYGEIVEAIKDLSLLNKKYPELASEFINKALAKMKSEQVVTPELYEGITFSEEAPIIAKALTKMDEVVVNAGLVTVQNLLDVLKDKKFYEKEKYTNENVVYPLIDVLDELTNLRTLVAMMQVVANVVVEFTDKIGFDSSFLFEGLTNEQLLDDAKLALDYARNAVKLGGLEYLHTKDIANFDPLILADMVEGLYEFNVLHGNMVDVLDIIFTFVNTKINGIYFDIDYRTLKDVDYHKEFATIASAIREVRTFMDGLEYTSLSSLLNIVKNKDYVYENFYNETSYHAVTNAIRTLADSQILGAMLPDLLDFAINEVHKKGYDIVFLKDEVYTTEFKLEDIKVVANILDKAYDFGVVEYVFNKDIPEINEAIANEILAEVGKLHVLNLFAADLLAIGFNKVFEKANMNIVVTRDDFADVVIADEIPVFQNIVTELKALMNEKGLVSVLDVTDYIKAKMYKNKEFFDVATGEILANIVRLSSSSEIVASLLPYLADYGIDKMTKIDLSVLKGAFTKDELASDLYDIADAIVPAIKAELVGLMFKESVKELPLHFEEYKEIITAIQDLNLINKKWPDFAPVLVNKVLELMKSNNKVSAEDFAGLTFAQDVPYLLQAMDEFSVTCEKASVVKVQDVIDIINEKGYLLEKYANEEIVTPLLNAVEQVTLMANIEAFLPAMLNHLADYLRTKKIDVAFLLKDLTKEELISDARLLVTYARDAVKLGVLEYVTTRNIAEFDALFASDMVEGLYEFNMMNHHAPEVMEKLMKIVNSKVKDLQFNITLEEFETIDYANEFKVLGEVIDYLAPFMESQVMHSLKDLVSVVKDKLYKSESFYNEETVDAILAMVNKVTELETLKLALPDLVDYLVEFAKGKGYDISFIQNEAYTVDYQIEDIRTLTVILDKAYDFGVVDYIFNKDILEIDEVLLNEILEEAINLHILELFLPDVIALGVNKVFEKAKMDIHVTRDEFTEVVLADEVHALQDVVLEVKALMNQKGLVSVQDVLDVIKNKEYQNKEFFDEETGTILSNLVKELCDSEIVTVLLPKLFDYGIDKVSEKTENLDLTFLKGAFTKEELKSDALTLADAIVPVIQANLVGLLFKEDVKQIVLEPAQYGEILDIIKDMNVLNKCWPMLASALTNYVLDKMNSVQNVTADDFAGLTFAQDVPTFIEALNEYEAVLEKLNASTINDLTDIIKNKTYKDTTIANKDVATMVLGAVEKTVDALNVQAVLPAMLKHLTEQLTVKGTEVDYLFAITTNEQIIEDVYTLLATSQELVDYGMIEFALAGGEIDLNDFTALNHAIENVMNLHMMNGNQPNAFVTILNKLKVETETIDLFDVEWKSETANMINMLEAARKLLVHFELNTIAKIKAFDYKGLVTINDEFNQVLDIYDELLGYVAIDQVIPEIVRPVSKRYFDTNNKEILGFHEIYHNGDEFISDITSLQKVVRALRNLDLNGFLRCGMDYPFGDKENIETIISEVLGSYYLNNENRLDQLLHFVDSKVAADLSGISTEGINLRADIDEFILIYENFASITESDYWTLHKSGDKFNIALFGSGYALDHMLNIVDLYMDTTIYDKTGFAILIFAVPLIKVVAPNYYNALELDKVTVGMLDHDTPYFANILRTLIDLDISKVVENGTYFTEDVHQALTSILNDLFELEIGKGHGNAFFTELVNDLVNGKTINGVEVPEDTIIFENTSLRNDREFIEQIINEIYNFTSRENIQTKTELSDFLSNLATRENLKEFLSKDMNWTMMENIVSALNNMTFVEENGLSIMNQIVHPTLEQKGSRFAKYFDLSDYTNELFVSDLDTLQKLIASMNHLGAASIIRDEEIAYEKVEDIQNILVSISKLYYMESHMDQIIDFLSRRLPFSLEALHSDDFAFANDMLAISEAYSHLVPYLTSANNQFKTLSSITNFVKDGFKVTKSLLISTADYLYDFADAYDILVNVTALALVAPELVEFVKPKLPEKFQGVANAVSFEGMSFAEVQKDLKISSELLRNLIDFGIAGILDNKDIPFTGMVHSTLLDEDVTRAEMINMMIENVRHMICLSNRSELVLGTLELMKVDTTSIDLTNVDWEAEFDNLEVLVLEGIAILEDYGLHTSKEVMNYIKSINKSNFNSEMKRVYRAIKANIEHITVVAETLDSSIAFNQLFKPLYNKYVLPQLPKDIYDLGNLEEYTIADLDEDMARLVVITRALKEMKDVPGSVKDNATLDECIIPTQTIIEEFFALNLLDQKKQEIVRLIDKLSNQVDLSTLDVSNVDLANDGKTLAQYAAEILIVYKNMNGYRLTTADMANTELMAALITIYNGCVDTDTVQIIAHWVYDKYVAPIEQERQWVSRFATVDETVAQMAKELGSILDAFLEMGVFSNNGIDFTNKAATDKLFGIFENVYIFTDPRMILIDMLKEGFEELGVIPFSYENVHMKNEIKVVRDVLKLVRDFAKNHTNELKQNLFGTLDSYAIQSEIDDIIARMFDSVIAKQIALPVINGMTKIYTRDIYALTIFEGMTEIEFKDSFMSSVYDIIGKMNELEVSGSHFDYTNINGIIGLLDIIVNRAPFDSHLEELLKYVLYILKVDVRDEYLGDIDWTTEYANFRLALQEMKDAMTGVVISDASTMKNNTFLSALALALPHLNDSELLPIIARQSVEMLLHKIDNSDRFNYYINRMYSSSYTNELLMKDYRLLPDAIKAVIDLGYFEGGINYQELDPVVELLEIFFELEFVKGDEVRYFNAITKRVDLISKYEIDYTLVTDWDAEKVVLINAMKELVAFTHLVDINNVTPEAFNDKAVQDQFVATIDAMSKSIIGQQLVPQLYADKIEPNLGHSDYQGVIDFNDPAFTPDCWAAEFEKFFEAYNILQKYEYGSQSKKLVNADAIQLMKTLFGTRENKAAGIMTIANNPKLWLTRLYNNKIIPVPENALINSESDRDWNDEPYRIIDVLEQMENFTTSEGVFTYDEVYSCQNEAKLHELLETVNNCVALRETILPIILNTMDSSPAVETALYDAGLINAEFEAVCDEWTANGTYDANYWTVERIEAFARVIAQTNANA